MTRRYQGLEYDDSDLVLGCVGSDGGEWQQVVDFAVAHSSRGVWRSPHVQFPVGFLGC